MDKNLFAVDVEAYSLYDQLLLLLLQGRVLPVTPAFTCTP